MLTLHKEGYSARTIPDKLTYKMSTVYIARRRTVGQSLGL